MKNAQKKFNQFRSRLDMINGNRKANKTNKAKKALQ